MANKIYVAAETAVTWINTGGTHVLTLTSVAASAGRKGDKHDWGASRPEIVTARLKTKFAVAPTSGAVLQVWWCSSDDDTDYDGGLSQGDATSSDTDIIRQSHWIGNLVADNTTNAQTMSWKFAVPSRYGFPIIFNATGQALSGTAGDHKFSMIPYPSEIQ